jgi:hypothetical protein
MIESVKLTRLKRFTNSSFALHPNGISFLAGGNNSGKSTLLQAIAVWEFCRLVLENERGRESLSVGYGGQGLGLSDDEFSPIAVASLKHLWTNLKSQIPGQMLFVPFGGAALICRAANKRAKTRSAVALFLVALAALGYFYFGGLQASQQATLDEKWTAATLSIGLLPFFVGLPLLGLVGIAAMVIARVDRRQIAEV